MRRRVFALGLVAVAAALVVASAASALGGDRARHRATLTVAAAADIACTPGEIGAPPDGMANGPDNCLQGATASLIEGLAPNAVLAPGDIQYNSGRLTEFLGSFDPTWGVFKTRIYPAAGNHEWYDSPNGQGYFDYFDGVGASGGRAGARGQGYYSVDLNPYWHLITLNSNCTSDNASITAPVPCKSGSAQERWLKADLAAHRGMCIIAQWHHPLYTSGPNQGGPNDLATRSFWHDLYAAGATLILNGHDHGYERFAPQTDTGALDMKHGVREFVVGTGGKSLFGPGPLRAANSQIYDVTTFGVLVLTLNTNSYQWNFIRAPVAGNGVLTDSGSAACNTPPAK
jgi:hypothetical protein